MHMRLGAASRSKVAPALVVVLAVATGACGGGKASAGTTPARVTVFAAASLTEAFGAEKAVVGSGTAVTYSFAGSGVLVRQVQQGAPADVVATADTASMATLVAAGLVDAPQTFAHNKLEILVAPGNPEHIHTLADLGRSGLVVVLGDATVPAGRYAKAILARAHVAVHPRSLAPDVKSAVRDVTSGDADATIVYATDVTAAGSAGEGVVIPDAQNAVATYPVAVVKASTHRAAAKAFVAALLGARGQAVLARHHFLPAAK